MLNGYTYSQRNNSRNYYCSKKDHGCKARVCFDIDGTIKRVNCFHDHEPPKYVTLKNGQCVKLYLQIYPNTERQILVDAQRIHVLPAEQFQKLLLFEKELRLQGASLPGRRWSHQNGELRS
ncbi:hypothetical protein ABMA28_001399 [Loxostege sticticalis]|uniref:FLYWCH-type domain-containing protein n=1 Tax=Loxostege sticticalis TaxID=481309 RepID=A0ABD0T1U4_LOXSC